MAIIVINVIVIFVYQTLVHIKKKEIEYTRI